MSAPFLGRSGLDRAYATKLQDEINRGQNSESLGDVDELLGSDAVEKLMVCDELHFNLDLGTQDQLSVPGVLCCMQMTDLNLDLKGK